MALAHIACVLYGGELGDALPIVVPDRFKKQISESRCRQVLVSLAYHANSADVSFPSAATVAKGCGFDESKVRVALRVLEGPPNSYLLRIGGYKVGVHGVRYLLQLPDFERGYAREDEVLPKPELKRRSNWEMRSCTQAYDIEEEKDLKKSMSIKPNMTQVALEMFEQFWDAYPRKNRRTKALEQWGYAIQKADPKEIIAAVSLYADQVFGHDEEFIAFASNWVRDERWEDEY